jgi:purine nucleosidase
MAVALMMHREETMPDLIIDTDTGSDDAVALVMALRHPSARVSAITTVAGNVPLDLATQNALYTVALCGAGTPVYAGRHAPLLRPLFTGQHVHGADGMGDIGLPLSGRVAAPGHAVDVIIDTCTRRPGEITLVTLGPLTNIALALLREPALAQVVRQCVVMGGASDGYGNVSPVAEFNIWADPEAARIVFDSGMPLTMAGWDVSRQNAVIDRSEAAQLRAIGTPLAEFCIDIQAALLRYLTEHTGLNGFDLPDPIALAIAIDPLIASEVLDVPVLIDTSDGLCRGQTILDMRRALRQHPVVRVVRRADRARFIAMLDAALR